VSYSNGSLTPIADGDPGSDHETAEVEASAGLDARLKVSLTINHTVRLHARVQDGELKPACLNRGLPGGDVYSATPSLLARA
jgi:hypothetical protein